VPLVNSVSAIAPSGTTSSMPVKAVPRGEIVVGATLGLSAVVGVTVVGVTVVGATVVVGTVVVVPVVVVPVVVVPVVVVPVVVVLVVVVVVVRVPSQCDSVSTELLPNVPVYVTDAETGG
jgi:hypothetical protein